MRLDPELVARRLRLKNFERRVRRADKRRDLAVARAKIARDEALRKVLP